MPYARNAIARVAGYTPGEQPKDRRYIKLNTNENPYPPSPRVAEALRTVDPERLRLYPDPEFSELRRVAAAQAGLTPDWLLCGNGSDDLLTIATRTFVDQGGALAYFDPSYSLYPVLAQLQGARALIVPLTTDFGMPADAAQQATGCSIFFVARPNAPTGYAYPLADMHSLCAGFPGIVWIDEAYIDFAADSCLEFVRQYPNVVVSRTCSKSYSLAGLRLGIAYARPELIVEMTKVKDSYNVSMLTQVLGTAAIADGDYVRENAARICRTRDWATVEVTRLGCRVVPSSANFLFMQTPKAAADLFRGLREKGILVRYFPGPRTGSYLRVTVGTEEEMQSFVTALAELLKQI